MANLSLTDLLSFAKAGYSPKDVKELLTMEVPEPKVPEAVVTGLFITTPAILTLISGVNVLIRFPPPLLQIQDHPYRFSCY